jgi:hypothetical protein
MRGDAPPDMERVGVAAATHDVQPGWAFRRGGQ